MQLLGQAESARLENRVPGGDVNPYLALAAMIAGGCTGLIMIWNLVELTGNVTRLTYRAFRARCARHGRPSRPHRLPRRLRGRCGQPLHHHG